MLSAPCEFQDDPNEDTGSFYSDTRTMSSMAYFRDPKGMFGSPPSEAQSDGIPAPSMTRMTVKAIREPQLKSNFGSLSSLAQRRQFMTLPPANA